MRNLVAASGAALAMTALAASGQASAFEVVIGGLAGQCSAAAKAGKFDNRSEHYCDLALASEPLNHHDRAGTLINRGAMRLMREDWDPALADFDEALRINPSAGEAHIGRGVYLIHHEQFAAAEPELDQGLQLGSEEPEKGYYFRGIARWGQENFKGAYQDFHKALDLKPNWTLPRQQLSNFKVEPPG